jgi:flagellar protein FliS
MTPNETTTAYLRSKVMSASPEELRLMLLDGALRFARQAEDGLENRNFEHTYAGFTQCRAIVLELANSIRTEQIPEFGSKLQSLYHFMYSELVAASHEKDVERLRQVIDLLEYERETWVLAMDRAAQERAETEAKPAARAVSYQA